MEHTHECGKVVDEVEDGGPQEQGEQDGQGHRRVHAPTVQQGGALF